VVEVNSTVFLEKRGKMREVRNLRRGGFDPNSFAGMLHGAEACRKLGSPWVNAFVRSRIGARWRFLPSQLRFLETYSHAAWKRERSLRRGGRVSTPLPGPREVVSEALQMCTGIPDPDEVAALVSHQWQYGRERKKREDEFSPSIGSVRKTFVLRRRRWFGQGWAGASTSYPSHIAALAVPKEPKKPTYFVPRGYVSMREEEGVNQLFNWRVAVLEGSD
jgi:hypothetical protein